MSPADGATPLDPDEADGLIPAHVITRDELNAWEQANIAEGAAWLVRRGGRQRVLTMSFLQALHAHMFGNTWRWAGRFRRSGKNIGVPWETIPQAVQQLLDDTAFWVEHSTYPADEIAARFHHRLVQIHPFPNGNGRHGRLMTDALLRELQTPPFTWGSGDLDQPGEVRVRYLDALHAADRNDYGPLLAFVRS